MLGIPRWISDHLGSLILAFVLAIVVWVSAVVSADPNEERTLRPIALDLLGQPSNLVVVNSLPSQVRLTLNAPRSIWSTLNENPSLTTAWVDLTGLEPGTHTVEVKTKVDIRPYRFVSLDPTTVQVQLEPLVRRELPIQLVISGELPLGYSTGTSVLQPESVQISGPESAVTRVAQARVELNISGAIETIKKTALIEFVDKEGQAISGLSVSTKEVSITEPVSLLGRFKNVAVKVVTSGQVANGYRLTNISVSPPTFTVFSEDPELINEIPGFVETMPVDLNNLADDAVISVDLNLPQGITTVRDPSVMVQVSVAAIEGSLTLTLPVEITGLDPELQAAISPETIDVIVAGPLFILDRLVSENFRVVVDLSGLPPGIYQRTPNVDLVPEQVRIQTTLPEMVEVTIDVAPTPTATPTNLTPTVTETPAGFATPSPPAASLPQKPPARTPYP